MAPAIQKRKRAAGLQQASRKKLPTRKRKQSGSDLSGSAAQNTEPVTVVGEAANQEPPSKKCKVPRAEVVEALDKTAGTQATIEDVSGSSKSRCPFRKRKSSRAHWLGPAVQTRNNSARQGQAEDWLPHRKRHRTFRENHVDDVVSFIATSLEAFFSYLIKLSGSTSVQDVQLWNIVR